MPKKQYAIDQCALYAIKGKGQLKDRIGCTAEQLIAAASSPGAHKVWEENGRVVQAASPELRKIHARIATLLRRVQPPEYRHSGVRKRSFLTNARAHSAVQPSLKLDVSKFYPSTTAQHVRKFFLRVMKCSADIAEILTMVCCYHGRHLPTGGVHSEVLAFYCHKAMLDALHARVLARGGVMTVYVDDIVITMPTACQTDLEWAKRLMERANLTMHSRKSRVIPAKKEKLITGVRIHKGKITAPAGQHRKVKELYESIARAPDGAEPIGEIRSLQGHLDHIAQIDPTYVPRAVGNRARYKTKLIPS